jgi:hypothetical protein
MYKLRLNSVVSPEETSQSSLAHAAVRLKDINVYGEITLDPSSRMHHETPKATIKCKMKLEICHETRSIS